MFKKGLFILCILTIVSISFLSVSAQEYTIRVGHTGAPDHFYQYGLEDFAEKVAEKTDGKVEVLVFPADQLGGQRQEVEGCTMGTHDMVLTSTMVLSNFGKDIGVFDMPFLFSNREHAYIVADSEIGDEIAAKLEPVGIKLLAYWENGFRYITNSVRPIAVPEDVEGLKIRVPESPVFLDTFTTLGAAATPMAFGEVFSALQLGTVDGQENPAGHVIVNAFYEVQDYISLTGHFYTYEPLVMSKALFDSLPADIQQALLESAAEAGDWERQASLEFDEDSLEQIEEVGMEILEVDKPAFKKAVQPVYDKYSQYAEWIERINALDPTQ
jgi:TRAP-type transport system periplasmic protein